MRGREFLATLGLVGLMVVCCGFPLLLPLILLPLIGWMLGHWVGLMLGLVALGLVYFGWTRRKRAKQP